MLDEQLIRHVKRHGERYDAKPLFSSKTSSGAVKEISYCRHDHCFYVTVNGRERFRGDAPDTVFNYFCNAIPN